MTLVMGERALKEAHPHFYGITIMNLVSIMDLLDLSNDTPQ